ncbi:hypothetical protein OAS39_10590 [Pirellulales bacterium]|nr:hypothetical protein [Pirellulales bacterium]
MFQRYGSLLLLFCLVDATHLAAQTPGKTVAAASPLTAAELYPLADGSVWHYVMNTEKGKWDMTYQVAKLENSDQDENFRVEMLMDGKIVITEQLSQTPKGLYRVRYQDSNLSPPLLLLRNPIKPNDTWTTKTQIGAEELTIGCKTGTEKVETPAGKFDAVKLTVTTRADEKDIRTDYWFANDVGIVKQVVVVGKEPKMSIELKKYAPGKSIAAEEE